MSVDEKMTALADAIRDKTGSSQKMNIDEMTSAVSKITIGGDMPEEAFSVTGNCENRFCNAGWNWYINSFGSQVKTQDITSCKNMFLACYKLEEIAFEINCKTNTLTPCDGMFSNCNSLKHIPKINNCKVANMEYLFRYCYALREIPDDIEQWFDWSGMDNGLNNQIYSQRNMFQGCWLIRKIPIGFLNHGNPNLYYQYMYLAGGFKDCYCLDELDSLPIPYETTITNNILLSCFQNLKKAKTVTFAMPNGSPYKKKWKNQSLDLSTGLGYFDANTQPHTLPEVLSWDKRIYDDGSYQNLKDDPDSFAVKIEYSKYNHDSAVATINSLPDTSEYLATAGGTNTVKFKKKSGELTDGGAIETLTEEEIAVATAKGWTIALVD